MSSLKRGMEINLNEKHEIFEFKENSLKQQHPYMGHALLDACSTNM